MEYYADINNTVMKSVIIKPLMTVNCIYYVIYEKIIYILMYNLNIYVCI